MADKEESIIIKKALCSPTQKCLRPTMDPHRIRRICKINKILGAQVFRSHFLNYCAAKIKVQIWVYLLITPWWLSGHQHSTSYLSPVQEWSDLKVVADKPYLYSLIFPARLLTRNTERARPLVLASDRFLIVRMQYGTRLVRLLLCLWYTFFRFVFFHNLMLSEVYLRGYIHLLLIMHIYL